MFERWWLHWLDPSIQYQSGTIALCVGTILLLINQGQKLFAGFLTLSLLLKTAMTYLVPYFVSSFTAIRTQLRILSGQEIIAEGTYRCEICLENGKIHEIHSDEYDFAPKCEKQNRNTEFVLYD